ncbi:hypothetical protein Bca52824_024825 [Brassica carinata]|uniref:PPIase cyclophilin-type domain-containing protein n=1 Tax=Brassica carinata TaxID=52824 RepID=A0A8X8AW80_BRACI|nr:hypothetical protein Bca52824_024825 [Brassica carinata]
MMLPNAKLSTPTSKFLPPPIEPPQHSRRTAAGASPSLELSCKLSRRNISKSSLLLLLGTQTTLTPLLDLSKAQADTISLVTDNPTSCGDRVRNLDFTFLDVSIGGEPVGRIVIGLYGDDAPAGTARFCSIVSGKAGISYRRKEFVKIMPGYVQHGGIRSYGADAERATAAAGSLQNLVEEWERGGERCKEVKAGSVGIVVRTVEAAAEDEAGGDGKLEVQEEEVALEESVLVIGEVLEGMGVVEKMREVKTVRDNTSSPYFKVAKVIGDKRAVVAERGFNRPYTKVQVTNCGLIESQ